MLPRYALLDDVFRDLAEVFPGARVHLGGDEVQFRCFNNSKAVRARMAEQGYNTSCPAAPGANGGNPCADGGPGFKRMVGDFVVRAQQLALSHGFRAVMGWQEIFDHYVRRAVVPCL